MVESFLGLFATRLLRWCTCYTFIRMDRSVCPHWPRSSSSSWEAEQAHPRPTPPHPLSSERLGWIQGLQQQRLPYKPPEELRELEEADLVMDEADEAELGGGLGKPYWVEDGGSSLERVGWGNSVGWKPQPQQPSSAIDQRPLRGDHSINCGDTAKKPRELPSSSCVPPCCRQRGPQYSATTPALLRVHVVLCRRILCSHLWPLQAAALVEPEFEPVEQAGWGAQAGAQIWRWSFSMRGGEWKPGHACWATIFLLIVTSVIYLATSSDARVPSSDARSAPSSFLFCH